MTLKDLINRNKNLEKVTLIEAVVAYQLGYESVLEDGKLKNFRRYR